jgi:hypothetical protein
VGGDRGGDHVAERQIGLEAEGAGAAPVFLAAGGQQHADPGRHVQRLLTLAGELVAVVERHIAEPGARALGVRDRRREAQLVTKPAQRPFLGEGEIPGAAAVRAGEGPDVLHDPGFLVVGLLDQEAVVGDLGGEPGGG